MRTLTRLACLIMTAALAFSCSTTRPSEKDASPSSPNVIISQTGKADEPYPVRLRFVPDMALKDVKNSSGRACWTALHPFPNPDSEELRLLAQAGIGGHFPVQEKGGPELFEVVVTHGDDDRLVVEVHSADGTQRVELQRDKPVPVDVGGITYTLSYPTAEVSSEAKKTVTDKATIFVSTPRQKP